MANSFPTRARNNSPPKVPGGSARSPEVLNPKTGQTVPADVARTGMLGWNTTRAT